MRDGVHAARDEKTAECLERGLGCDPNPAEAFRWAMASAEQGWVHGMALVIRFYTKGIGTAADRDQAAAWRLKVQAASN
jgi:uncharacterized protein